MKNLETSCVNENKRLDISLNNNIMYEIKLKGKATF